MRLGQLATLINTFIRSKDRYGLTIIGAEETMLKEDSKREEDAMGLF